MEQIVVGVAECAIGDAPDQVLATYGLGSCIALAVHDPVCGVGGLVHYMLPDSRIDSGQRRGKPCAYADTAIPALLDQLTRRGANPRRLRAHAAGGARMMGDCSGFDIGRRNHEALLRELARAGLTLAGEAIGGTVSRNLSLSVGTGKVRIWQSGGPHAR